MSAAEMQLRRERGQCFTCDERFSATHRCPNRQVMILHMDDEEIELEETSSLPDSPPGDPGPTETAVMHLSLHAMQGDLGAGTIKVLATIQGHPVQVLIDGGSSDNFLHPRVAKFLKLAVEPAPPLRVMVEDGSRLQVEGLVKDLRVHIQGLQLSPCFLAAGGRGRCDFGRHLVRIDRSAHS